MRLIDFKSYVEPVSTGAILGAAALSSGGQVASGLFKPSLKRQWKYQQKQMKLQQQYALEQMQKQGEINYANWQKQFDYENSYNDPAKVFDRYLKAGITPAAVLGGSGVGVNATMSGGSAGSVGASGPSGGSLDFSSPLPPGTGSAAASTALEAMGINSNIERNKAASNRDNAEAEWMRGNTHSADWRKDIDELDKQIRAHEVNSASALADLNRALADIHMAESEYADLMATYKFQDFVAQYGKHVEEYDQIKKFNSKYFDQIYAAQITRDYAAAYESAASGNLMKSETEIAKVRLADIREWFRLNWEVEVDVPQVTESGKPTGKTIKLTGRQIHEHLVAMSAASASQGLSAQWFQNRSEKNAFGYSMARTALAGALAIGGMALTKGTAAPAGYEESREIYGSDGDFRAGTYTSRRYVRGNR